VILNCDNSRKTIIPQSDEFIALKGNERKTKVRIETNLDASLDSSLPSPYRASELSRSPNPSL
jgi:hypothetical protein